MPTYAIGDIHGHVRTLKRLLERIRFDPSSDRLWLVGDLVNRGPDSLGVLRWAREHDAAITVVLGNHDLHLLGRAAGVRDPKQGDTLDDVLSAPDRDELIDWLRRRPFFHREKGFALVHAGLLPSWTLDEAASRAAELAAALQGNDYVETLEAVHRKDDRSHPDAPEPAQRWRALSSIFTRTRFCSRLGEPVYDFTGAPDDAPDGYVPWFAAPGRRNHNATVVFGHWAALGLHLQLGVAALDSGCVWGGPMSAVRLPDLAVFQQHTED
jgi:bis(5'-nucleosyl)-tetraphosphatase (symmetrical)